MALFLTTRPHPVDIHDSFQDASIIELTPKDHDIRRYVEGRLSEDYRFQRIQQRSTGLKDQTVSKIVDSAVGMYEKPPSFNECYLLLHRFLLAKFNVEYVVEFTTAREIKQALGELSIPETASIDASNPERENERRMDEVYSRIVCSIHTRPRGNQKYVFRALSWIGYATRTLTIQELLVAISVEANQYQLDESDMIRFEDLLDICNGLVIADGEDVRLVHSSVRNYLDRHQVIPEDAKETYRAIACSTYLSFDIFKEQRPSQDPDTSKGSLSFLHYAANNLAFHLSKVGCRHYPETTSAVMELLENKGQRRSYCRANDEFRGQLDIPPLNLACVIGYEDAVRTLLEGGNIDVNAKDSSTGLTSLSFAVVMEYAPVVKRLLGDDRVDRDCRDNSGATPLWLAVICKNTEIVRLLLENGVELNATVDIVSTTQAKRSVIND